MNKEEREEYRHLVALLGFINSEMNKSGAVYINIVIDSDSGLSSISSNLGEKLNNFEEKSEFVDYYIKRIIALFEHLEDSDLELEQKESSCDKDGDEDCKNCNVPDLLRQIVPYKLIKAAMSYIFAKSSELKRLEAEDKEKFDKFMKGDITSLTDDDINRYLDKLNIGKNASGD